MNKLLKHHQYILLAIAGVFLVQIFTYLFILRPKSESVKDLKASIEELRSSMTNGQWTADSAVLEQHLNTLRSEAEKGKGKSSNLQKAQALMGKTFLEKIRQEGYVNVTDFMENATLLNYRKAYDVVMRELKARYVLLAPIVLGIGQDPPEDSYKYQFLMRLWTADLLCRLALDSGLAIAMENKGGRVKINVSSVATLEPRGYFELPISERPYMIEFPVEITVDGTLKSCMKFIKSMDTETVYLAPVKYEIFALPPKGDEADSRGMLKHGIIRMKMTCSSFLVPETKKEK